jgi:hypothetical protein
MGYIEIVDIDENGVSVTDLSEVSDIVRLELWLALQNEIQKMKGNK